MSLPKPTTTPPSSSPARPQASAPNWPAAWPGAASRWCWSPAVGNASTKLPTTCARNTRSGSRFSRSTCPTPDPAAKLAERLRTEPIAGLCNSAGFGTSGVFHELPIERESEEVILNSLALMELTHAALPGMVERGAGAVLNIASIAGFQPIPYMAVYSATKAFVQTFSEAVHEELHGTGVSVTVLCPGPVPTEWAEIANAERFSIPLAQVSPHDVAEAAIGGMLAGKRSVVPGIVPKVVSIGGRYMPRTLLLPGLRIGNRFRGGPSH